MLIEGINKIYIIDYNDKSIVSIMDNIKESELVLEMDYYGGNVDSIINIISNYGFKPNLIKNYFYSLYIEAYDLKNNYEYIARIFRCELIHNEDFLKFRCFPELNSKNNKIYIEI